MRKPKATLAMPALLIAAASVSPVEIVHADTAPPLVQSLCQNCHGADGIAVMKVIDAAYSSLKNGNNVIN